MSINNLKYKSPYKYSLQPLQSNVTTTTVFNLKTVQETMGIAVTDNNVAFKLNNNEIISYSENLFSSNVDYSCPLVTSEELVTNTINSITDTIQILSDTIYIGNENSRIIFRGTNNISGNVANSFDKLININASTFPLDDGNNSGIKIRGRTNDGYIKTNNDSTKFLIKPPMGNESYIASWDVNQNISVNNITVSSDIFLKHYNNNISNILDSLILNTNTNTNDSLDLPLNIENAIYGPTNNPLWIIGNGTIQNFYNEQLIGLTNSTSHNGRFYDIYLTINNQPANTLLLFSFLAKSSDINSVVIAISDNFNFTFIDSKAYTITNNYSLIVFPFITTQNGIINIYLGATGVISLRQNLGYYILKIYVYEMYQMR